MNSRQSQGKITAIYCRLSRDDDLAAVVRRIFRMVIDGKGVYQIADILSEDKVLCPSAYLAAKGVGNRRNSKFEDPYRRYDGKLHSRPRGIHGAYCQLQDLQVLLPGQAPQAGSQRGLENL